MKEKIKNYILNHIGKNVEISDHQNLFETGVVSSIFAMQLIMFIEKEFQIKVVGEDLNFKNFSSIDNIDAFLQKKMGLLI